jgi:hypothetical protein
MGGPLETHESLASDLDAFGGELGLSHENADEKLAASICLLPDCGHAARSGLLSKPFPSIAIVIEKFNEPNII